MRRLIGVSTLPLVGSIYNMGVWDKVAAAWVNVATRRTLDREEAAVQAGGVNGSFEVCFLPACINF